jgi:hypothetical protein
MTKCEKCQQDKNIVDCSPVYESLCETCAVEENGAEAEAWIAQLQAKKAAEASITSVIDPIYVEAYAAGRVAGQVYCRSTRGSYLSAAGMLHAGAISHNNLSRRDYGIPALCAD